MDTDMDRGVSIDGERSLSPSQIQRNQFVIGQLLEALSINDSPSIVQHRHVMPPIWSTREDNELGRR